MNKKRLYLVIFFYTVCLLSVMTGCKDSRQKSVLELAAETKEILAVAGEIAAEIDTTGMTETIEIHSLQDL